MEQLLIKMARQLDALDEASLLALWEKYAMLTSHFEPTKRWEEAALVFSFIQAKRWKNQLFNYSWSSQVRPDAGEIPAPGGAVPEFSGAAAEPSDKPAARPAHKAVIIPFRPRRQEKPSEDGGNR